MKRAPVVWAVLWMLTLLVVATACWVGAFYATSWLEGRLGVAPPLLWHLVGTSLVGLAFMACPMVAVGLMRRPLEQALFQSILGVLRRIARGDFSARVETAAAEGPHPFNTFASTINSMAVELDRTERLRQEFVSNVSHEIQSPLTSIGGFARLLRDAELDGAERRRYLEIILAETERLSRVSDNLLKLTALEGERPPLERRPYRLDRQLRRVILAAEPLWTEKGLAVEADLADAVVAADEVLLEQVWVNLLGNAVKFTGDGGAVAVRLRLAGGTARVEVADTGIGIAQEDQGRIFERFFKADPARGRAAGGSGLGLALVKKIVELHGGGVAVESRPGMGTTLCVTLPVEARRG